MLKLSVNDYIGSLYDDIKVSFDEYIPTRRISLDSNPSCDKTLVITVDSSKSKNSVKTELESSKDAPKPIRNSQKSRTYHQKPISQEQKERFSFVKSYKTLNQKCEQNEEQQDQEVSPCFPTHTHSKQKTLNFYQRILENKEIYRNIIKQQSQEFLTKSIKDFLDNVQIDGSNSQYLRFQNYSFRKLGSQHRVQALKLLTTKFIEEEPLAKSFYKQFRDQKNGAYEYWQRYWNMYMDDAIQSGISIVVIDVANNEELVGVYTFKNFNYVPQNPDLGQMYLKGFNILSSEVVLEQQLIEKSSSKVQDILLDSQLIAEAWAAAIKDGHTGKKLYSKMTALAQKVLKKAGFKYVLVFASNFLSSKVLEKLDFTEISRLNCKQFKHLGEEPFALIEEEHKFSSLWLKELQ